MLFFLKKQVFKCFFIPLPYNDKEKNMEEATIESIFTNYMRKVEATSTTFHRYLYKQIQWDAWVIGIKGARGVGKTTLLLQHIKEAFSDKTKALYVSLDNIWFANHSLTDLVEYFYTHGGTHLFIDEVHKYPMWDRVIKNLADDYSNLHIVYTGSSMLQIDNNQGDMSRRQIVYTLREMSFREYLEFEGIYKRDAISLEQLLANHVTIATQITSSIKVLPLFEQYLKYGCYPFYKRDSIEFESRLQEVINQILYTDLPAVEDVSFATIQKTRRLLMILAERVPQTPKMTELYNALESSREQGLKMLYALERASLINLITTEPKNVKSLVKPNKILLGNPNLMYALSPIAEIGTIREAFFVNQLSAIAEVLYPNKGDFYVNRKYLFEVGGRKKSFEQIKDEPNSFLAVDATEIGNFSRIPLWMFGLLY